MNKVDVHLVHGEGDELANDSEEDVEDALDDVDQLRGGDTDQGDQGETDNVSERWRHRDRDPGTGRELSAAAPGTARPRVMDLRMRKYLLCKYLLYRGKLANFCWKQFLW